MKKYKSNKLLAVVLLVLLLSSLSFQVFAYDLLGHYVANQATQYAWGDNIQDFPLLKNGWLDAIEAWGEEGMYIGYNSISQNKLESRHNETYEYGMAIIELHEGYKSVKQFVCYMNSNHVNWSVNSAKGTGTHELGHVIGLDETTGTAVMNPDRNRFIIYTIQTDDRNGYNAIYN